MDASRNLNSLPEPQSRTAAVAELIRHAILSGTLSAGEVLVERKLSAQLGVSKTPVREALISLSHSGLVTFSPYRGVSVRAVDAELVHSVYEMRGLLEPHAIRQSVPRHDRQSIGAAAGLLREAEEAGDAGDFAALSLINRSFHRTLYERCDNDLLVSTLDGVQDQVALCAVTLWYRDPVWREELAEHRAILDAVATGSNTTEAVKTHINTSSARLIASLD